MAVRRDRPKRDAELLDTASKVFWQKGYAAATVQDVADVMGVLKGSLYYYIESKEELLFRIFDDTHADAQAIAKAAAELDASPLERLRWYFESFVSFYLANIERVSLYFRDWRYLTGERREIILAQRKEYDSFIIDTIQAAQEAGEVSSEISARYAAFYILGAINAIPDWYRRDGRDGPERISQIYTQLSVATLGTPVTATGKRR